MSKHTIHLYQYMQYEYLPDYSDKAWQPDVWSCRVEDSAERILIKEIDIEVEVPDDFDPVPRQVAALEQQKAEALREYQEKVSSINQQLSKLQAITYEPS
jgi:hypothetical protein